ncbi:MAG: molybdopterin-binding protein [Chromatiaceae bacterium]
MSRGKEPIAFGLIVVGDEVLNGRRSDRHLAHFKALLGERGHFLAWHWVLPDDPPVLTDHLRFSMSRPAPVFVCGGIGATPDDHTRACAAAASGVALALHPEAVALIEGRVGADAAYPSRILMAELPQGCSLIPNPYNQIPGFSVGQHFFLPGFPEMAWPMAQWVLDTGFPTILAPQIELAVQVRGVPESRLIPLMQRLGDRFPEHKLFSLPHLGTDPHILLGIRGREGIDLAFEALRSELAREQIEFTTPTPGGA